MEGGGMEGGGGLLTVGIYNNLLINLIYKSANLF